MSNQRHPLPVDSDLPPAPSAAPQLPGKPPLPVPLTLDEITSLKERIVQVLHTCFDPEIPVNIYELGLIYDIIVTSDGVAGIRMTLTAPACPAAQFLPIEVRNRVAAIPDVTDVKVDIVWEPPWDRSRMSEAAKLQLGMF